MTPINPETDVGTQLDIWKAYFRTLQKLKNDYPAEYAKVPEVVKHYDQDKIANLTMYDVEALKEMNAVANVNLPGVTRDEIITARAYLKNLSALIGTDEFPKVPAVLKISEDEIANLDAAHLQAYRLMNALPGSKPGAGYLDEMKSKELDKALTDYCNSDPELRAIAQDPALYRDQEMAQQFAAHPKIQAFFASRPDMKRILDENVARMMKPYLDNMPFRFTRPQSGLQPYMTQPYGTANAQPSAGFFSPGLFGNPKQYLALINHIGNAYSEGAKHMMEASTQSMNRMGEVFRKAGG